MLSPPDIGAGVLSVARPLSARIRVVACLSVTLRDISFSDVARSAPSMPLFVCSGPLSPLAASGAGPVKIIWAWEIDEACPAPLADKVCSALRMSGAVNVDGVSEGGRFSPRPFRSSGISAAEDGLEAVSGWIARSGIRDSFPARGILSRAWPKLSLLGALCETVTAESPVLLWSSFMPGSPSPVVSTDVRGAVLPSAVTFMMWGKRLFKGSVGAAVILCSMPYASSGFSSTQCSNKGDAVGIRSTALLLSGSAISWPFTITADPSVRIGRLLHCAALDVLVLPELPLSDSSFTADASASEGIGNPARSSSNATVSGCNDGGLTDSPKGSSAQSTDWRDMGSNRFTPDT